jgi:putative transposase
MRNVCADFGAELTEFNGERDHVHLLVHYPPKIALSRLVGSLKGVSARRLRQEFPDHIHRFLWGDHFWSPSYFAASVGGAPLSVVMDSSGINVLIAAHRASQDAQGWLRLAGPQQAVLHVLQLVGVDTLIPCHPTRQHALDNPGS